jgi:hypothetical protein
MIYHERLDWRLGLRLGRMLLDGHDDASSDSRFSRQAVDQFIKNYSSWKATRPDVIQLNGRALQVVSPFESPSKGNETVTAFDLLRRPEMVIAGVVSHS